MNKNSFLKKLPMKKIEKIFYIALGACGVIFVIYIIYVLNIYMNRIHITQKEEFVQFIEDNEKELEQVIHDMQKIYEETNDLPIIIYKIYKNEWSKERSKSMNTLFQKYSIERISMGDSYTGNSYARNIKFLFDTKDTGYDYWGIYYSENDTIILWEVSPYEEDNGIYRQNGSYYKYETEKITGKWYLYKCNVF